MAARNNRMHSQKRAGTPESPSLVGQAVASFMGRARSAGRGD